MLFRRLASPAASLLRRQPVLRLQQRGMAAAGPVGYGSGVRQTPSSQMPSSRTHLAKPF